MNAVRWAECNNQDGQHAAWFAMFARESAEDVCPGNPQPEQKIDREFAESKIGKGPGTELVLALGAFKLVGGMSASCGCWDHAQQMNRNQADWCRDNIAEIVGWLRAEAEKQKLFFSDYIARQLIKLSIRRAVRRAGR